MDYLEWEKIITCIYNVTFASKEEHLMNTEEAYENTQNKLKEKANETLVIPSKECEESDEKFEEIFKITRQRSSGPNIFETKRHALTPQENGATRKTVLKDVYAKLTTSNSQKHVSKKDENKIKTQVQKKPCQPMVCGNQQIK
jgi:hypothetical protein